MHVLVVDGWTHAGNLDHGRAGCSLQCDIFRDLILESVPSAQVTIMNTHDETGDTGRLDLAAVDAAVWTGGGGNIYQDDGFNRRQLALCEKVLNAVPYVWGSCWGLQVIVTVLGGKVASSSRPEIGIARDIRTRPSKWTDALYATKTAPFDAPAHHFDEIAQLSGGFEIVAENAVTLQAIGTPDGRIFCTQYHPEMPYDLVARLLRYWAPNYRSLFDEDAFQALLASMPEKELAESSARKIEFQNWLACAGNGGLAFQVVHS